MKTYQGDLSWLIREARNAPDTSIDIINELGHRIIALQEENEKLRAENIALNRAGSSQYREELEKLKTIINKLTDFIEKEGLNKKTVAFVSSDGKGLQVPFSLLSAVNSPFSLQNVLSDTQLPIHIFLTRRYDSLLMLTYSFQVIQDYAFTISYSNDVGLNALQPLTNSAVGVEKIAVICKEQALHGKPFVILVTRRGFIKRFLRKTFTDLLNTGQPIISGINEDIPSYVLMPSGNKLLLITKHGKWIKIPQTSVTAQGDVSLELDNTDEIVGALEVNDQTNIFFVGEDGSTIAIKSSGLTTTTKLGGKGRVLPKQIRPIACFSSSRNPSLIWLTKNGKIGVTSLHSVPVAKELKDVKYMNLIQQELIAGCVVSSGN